MFFSSRRFWHNFQFTEIQMLGVSTSRSESCTDFTSCRCILSHQTGRDVMELHRRSRGRIGHDRIRERTYVRLPINPKSSLTHFHWISLNFPTGDQCPMYFDDGADPWTQSENFVKIFNWDFVRSSSSTNKSTDLIILAILGLVYHICRNIN